MAKKRKRKLYLRWSDIDQLVDNICEQLSDTPFDYILVLSRGGLVPGGLISSRLDFKRVLVASIESRDEKMGQRKRFRIYSFPDERVLEGKIILIVDDVWDTGKTTHLIAKKVRRAGGRPLIAVLHYKPKKSIYPRSRPDFYASIRHVHIVYPWEKKRRSRKRSQRRLPLAA